MEPPSADRHKSPVICPRTAMTVDRLVPRCYLCAIDQLTRRKEPPVGKPFKTSRSENCPEFKARILEVSARHGSVPPPNEGRLRWVSERFAERGQKVSLEGVRRWFSGVAIPRRKSLKILAEILGVDAYWLLEGDDVGGVRVGPVAADQTAPPAVEIARAARPKLSRVLPVRPSMEEDASGETRIVAGFFQFEGGATAIPKSDDPGAVRHGTDLHAVMKGRLYDFIVADTVVTEKDICFRVKDGSRKNIVLGVVRNEVFGVSIFKLPWEQIVEKGQVRDGRYVVSMSRLKAEPVTSFASLS